MQCEVRCGKACSVSQPCSVASLVITSATATTKQVSRLLLRRGYCYDEARPEAEEKRRPTSAWPRAIAALQAGEPAPRAIHVMLYFFCRMTRSCLYY